MRRIKEEDNNLIDQIREMIRSNSSTKEDGEAVADALLYVLTKIPQKPSFMSGLINKLKASNLFK